MYTKFIHLANFPSYSKMLTEIYLIQNVLAILETEHLDELENQCLYRIDPILKNIEQIVMRCHFLSFFSKYTS